LSEIDPRSLAQARDALIVQTDRLHRLRSEKDEAVAETTRIDAELQQTRAQWKKAVDAHDEATAAIRDVQRELDDAKEAVRRALTRRDADAAEMEEARSAVSLF
jgi:chromosome segregation ATPase